jgi:hypothetical protein
MSVVNRLPQDPNFLQTYMTFDETSSKWFSLSTGGVSALNQSKEVIVVIDLPPPAVPVITDKVRGYFDPPPNPGPLVGRDSDVF